MVSMSLATPALADKKAGPSTPEVASVKAASQGACGDGQATGGQGKADRADQEIGPDEMNRMVKEAGALTEVRVEELRARPKGDPKDLEARRLLIFHALSSRKDMSSPAELGLLLGLIENHPTNPLSCELPRMLANRPQYDEAARTWLAVAKGHEDDAAVLGNAGAFLTGAILNTTYRDRGEALLKRPGRWSRIGHAGRWPSGRSTRWTWCDSAPSPTPAARPPPGRPSRSSRRAID